MTAQDPYQPHPRPPAPGPAPPGPPAYGPAHPHPAPAGFQPQFGWPPMMVQAPPMIDGFFVVQPRLKPIPSGQAVGSLVAGIGGILGALPGLLAAAFSPWAGLTFVAMATLLGGGSLLLASYAKRRIRASAGGFSGGGMATTGLILGIVAVSLAGLAALISLLSF